MCWCINTVLCTTTVAHNTKLRHEKVLTAASTKFNLVVKYEKCRTEGMNVHSREGMTKTGSAAIILLISKYQKITFFMCQIIIFLNIRQYFYQQ